MNLTDKPPTTTSPATESDKRDVQRRDIGARQCIALARSHVAGIWSRVAGVWSRVAGVWRRFVGVWSRVASVWWSVVGVWLRIAGIWSRVASVWWRFVGVWSRVASVWRSVVGNWLRVAGIWWRVASVWSRSIGSQQGVVGSQQGVAGARRRGVGVRQWRARQRASALLSVLMLFSLVMLIVTQVVAVNRKAIEKTEYLFDGIRARQLLPLAESLAGARLGHHLSRRGYDGGAVPSSGIGVGDGWSVSYTITDLQARINLNNPAFNSNWRPVVENLVQEDKKKTVSRLIDWVDKDDKKIDIHGGEKGFYKQQLRRRVIANRPMVHPSEFRHIHDVEDEVWYAIRDRVTALPAQSTINVNSAPGATIDLLLVAYTNYPLLTGNGGGWPSTGEFLASPVMAGHNLVDNNQIDTSTSYWLFELEIKSPRRNYPFHSRVYHDKDSGRMHIIDRFSGPYIAK